MIRDFSLNLSSAFKVKFNDIVEISICDFLLVLISNHMLILHRVAVTAV